MKKSLSLIIVCLTCICANAQVANWLWGRDFSSYTGEQEGLSVATDRSGNVYAIGTYDVNMVFANDTLTGTGGSTAFLVKYDENGDELWARSGQGLVLPNFVTTDTAGNVFVTGSFLSPTLSFGSITLTNIGASSTFIVKYDPLGNVLWAKQSHNASVSGAYSVAAAPSGDVFITGYFYASSITFNSHVLNNSSTTVSSPDMFIVKYDAAGNVTWATSIGASGMELGTSISIDTAGQIYATGIFNSPTLSISSQVLTNYVGDNKTYDFFICKYSATGTLLWAKSQGGSKDDKSYSIITDLSGNVYLAGAFYSPTLTCGSTTLSTMGAYDMLLIKYNSSGTVLWAQKAGSFDSDIGYSLALAPDGEGVYLTGSFGIDYSTSPVTMYIGPYAITTPAMNEEPMFIAKYDPNGNVICATPLLSGGDDQSGVATDAAGNAYVVSDYICPVFIFGSDTLTLSTMNEAFFIAKYNCETLPMGENEIKPEMTALTIYPNPFTEAATLKFSSEQKNSIIRILDLFGNEIAKINFSGSQLKLERGSLAKGVYIIQVLGKDNNTYSKKMIIQ